MNQRLNVAMNCVCTFLLTELSLDQTFPNVYTIHNVSHLPLHDEEPLTIDYGPGASGYAHTHEHRARDDARAFLQRCYRRIREGKVAQEAHLGQLKLLCGSYSYVCLAVNNVSMSA